MVRVLRGSPVLIQNNMRSRNFFLFFSFTVSIAAFLLARVIWPEAADAAGPESAVQLAAAIGISFAEALAFGFGMGYLLCAWPRRTNGWTVAEHLSLSWLLVSWYPHDNFHRVNGEHFVGLLIITYAFHVSLIIAGAILVGAYRRLHRARP